MMRAGMMREMSEGVKDDESGDDERDE